MLDDVIGTMLEIAVMFGIVVVIFLGVIPAILWTFDKFRAWRRHYKIQAALVDAIIREYRVMGNHKVIEAILNGSR